MSSTVPERVGPYLVEHRIGRGGMGEVYRGHDSRLDRPVALKRILPEAEVSAATRARFRREGRSLARVRHPAVVAVHDWIEAEDSDWLVMEFLEGRSLQEVIEEGGVPLLEALRITRQLAAGLAAAHAQGIVHRDLKPSNIMLLAGAYPGSENQVKILDFGLAKRVVSMDGLTLTDSISQEAQLIGTVHFMSPEQASGRRVDERSDLFSLGVILYTLLTHESPFGRGDLIDVLTRICTAAERPPHEVDSAIPKPVSKLVGHLLEKDPERRPRHAVAVMETLERLEDVVASGRADSELSLGLPGGGPSGADTPSWLDAETRIRQEGPLGPGETTQSESGKETSEDIAQPSEPESRSQIGGRSNRWRGRAIHTFWILGVLALAGFGLRETVFWGTKPAVRYFAAPETRLLVYGSEDEGRGNDDPTLELKRLAVHDGVLQALQGFDGVAVIEVENSDGFADPVALAKTVGASETLLSEMECFSSHCQILLKQVATEDGTTLWSRRLNDPTVNLVALRSLVAEQIQGAMVSFDRRGDLETIVRPEDYRDWLEIIRLHRAVEAPVDELLDRLARIRATSPQFIEAYVFAASILRQRFVVAREDQDLDAAIQLLEKALEILPESPIVLRQLALVLIEGGRLEEAEKALEVFARHDPGDATYFSFRGMLLERQGRIEEALISMREAVERQGSLDHWMDLAMMEYRQGNLEAARRASGAALALDPDNYGLLSRTGEIELVSGDLDRAAGLFETLVERYAGESELTNLGVAYLLLDRLDEATRRFEQALEVAPSSPYAHLNLADALALRGDTEAAADQYRQTLALVEADPDPDSLLTVGAQAQAHLGRHEKAIGAVQRAIRLGPDNPQVQFEAAVVYMVVGERTSALLHARRALELGVERRWFDFPWFEPIWADL